jgi:hypothetical protein
MCCIGCQHDLKIRDINESIYVFVLVAYLADGVVNLLQ